MLKKADGFRFFFEFFMNSTKYRTLVWQNSDRRSYWIANKVLSMTQTASGILQRIPVGILLTKTAGFKVKKILKDSMDSISSPSPSLKIQIMGGKVCLSCEKQNIAGCCQQTFEYKTFVTLPSNVLPLCFNKLSRLNLNFHWRWRWWDRFHAIF